VKIACGRQLAFQLITIIIVSLFVFVSGPEPRRKAEEEESDESEKSIGIWRRRRKGKSARCSGVGSQRKGMLRGTDRERTEGKKGGLDGRRSGLSKIGESGSGNGNTTERTRESVRGRTATSSGSTDIISGNKNGKG
jgi:hypothetical protein